MSPLQITITYGLTLPRLSLFSPPSSEGDVTQLKLPVGMEELHLRGCSRVEYCSTSYSEDGSVFTVGVTGQSKVESGMPECPSSVRAIVVCNLRPLRSLLPSLPRQVTSGS